MMTSQLDHEGKAEDAEFITINKKKPYIIDIDDDYKMFDEKYIKEDNDRGLVFQLNNDSSWPCLTPKYIKIHPWKKYRFTMEIKKSSNSSPYLRIVCYDKNKIEITSYDVLRSGYPAIIKSISQDGTKIICDRSISKWKGIEQRADQRWIGFYFDAEYEKVRADAYIKHYTSWKSTNAKDGAYCDIKGKIIYLSKPIDKNIMDKIKMNETLIDNHYGGSSHIYPYYHKMSKLPNDEWFTVSNEIDGTFVNFGETDNLENRYKFRKGTKFIKLLFTSDKGVASFKTCKIEEVDID